jgi:hypothetical protein
MKEYLGSTIKENGILAEAKICENAGIPDGKATEKWDEVSKDLNGMYYIGNPIRGWNGKTHSEMVKGVVGVNEVDIVLPIIEDEGV